MWSENICEEIAQANYEEQRACIKFLQSNRHDDR